jgi:nucleoside-diphosphate-sugar epimerase
LSDLKEDCEFVRADIRDPEAVHRAARGVDSVCHLASINGTEFFYAKPELVLDVAVRGMVNVIDACLEQHVSELVLVSSSEVYQTPPTVPTSEAVPLSIPDPHNPRYSYAAGKIISEVMAINYGRRHVGRVLIVRPHNVYGPNMGWEHVIPQFVLRMRTLCETSTNGPIRFPIQGTGKETRAFVYIDDFIDGLLLVLEHGAHLGIYHVGTMEEITIEMVALEIARYFNRQILIAPGEAVPGGTLRRCPDISKLMQLGYRPKVRFRDGLPVAAKWYADKAQRHPASQPLTVP